MMDLSPQQIGDLDPEQLEFLLRRLKKAGRKDGGEPARQAIPRREGPGPWPLSFAQQRLWFIHQLERRSAAYHIPIAVDLAGSLRPPLLAAALEGAARRHEVLRTTFGLVDGHPVQEIRPGLGISLPEVDLSALDGREREAELDRLAAEEAVRPFDLARGPMLRGVLVRREAARFRLLLTLHHVAADNWSVAVLMREVSALYGSLVTGLPASLPELPVQYADFSVWQRGWLQGEVLEKQLAFWRDRLDGAPRRLDLPADHPRPEIPSFRSGRLVFRLPEELAQGVKALGREQGTTLYNTLLAAWNALLARYAGPEDLVVGSPVANRQHTEIEGLIGFFVNTLLMRNRPQGALAFADFLASVHEASLGAFAHQDLPFEKIVEDLRPERDSSYQPLFQVMFNVYDGAMPELRFAGLEVEGVEVQIGTWNDLDLLLVDTRQGIEGYLRYSLDLFEPETAEAIAASFRELLETVVRAPRTRLADLPLSPALAARAEAARRRERKQLLAVSATFTADAIAESLDFWMRELDLPSRVEMAPYNQVFQQLLDPGSLLSTNRHGVNVLLVRLEDWAPEVERNADDLIAALEQASRSAAVPFLAVLCPSETAYPEVEERLRAALSSASNVHLATPAELAALYPVEDLYDAYTDRIGHVPYTLTGFAALGTLVSRRIHALSSPPAKVIVLDCDNTLWKGVCGEDGPHGVVLDDARRRLQEIVLAQQRDGMLLCLCSKNEEEDVWAAFGERSDFPLRREHLAAWRINWLPKSENLRSLARELDLGLDSFVFVDDNPVECAEVRAACPEVMVVELPGDDTAIPRTLEHFWAFDRLRTTAEDRERTALYRQAAERERHRRSAASFEEFLAGLGLAIDVSPMAPEQLARVSQLTQRTNQFNASTIRRTEAEIERRLDGGELECRVVEVRDRFGDYGLVGVVLFAAREDALEVDTFLLSCRVLGRGVEHRVLAVLGEEAAERGLGRVDVNAVPTAKNRPAFDFLRSLAGASEDGAVFRIPVDVARVATFNPSAGAEENEDGASAPVRTAAVPDRSRRLLRIAAELFDAREVRRRIEERSRQARTAGAGELVAPRTATEERVAAIFAEVLGAERVGVRDSFFDLGGHSLLGTVVLSRVRDVFGVELPVVRLFQSPTVEALAAAIEEAGAGALEPIDRILAGEPGLSGTGSFPASHPQEALWILHRLEPDSPAYNIPMALRLTGRLRRDVLERCLHEIVRRHWTLRTGFAESEGGVAQVVQPFASFPVPVFDLSGLADGERDRELARHVARAVATPFDLARAPLFRVELLRLSPEEHVVDLVVHHTVFDGWSMGVMVREMTALYPAFLEGSPSPLPELPIQYADFARWQRERMEKGGLEPQLAYWRERLGDRPEPLELPADGPRPARWSSRGASAAVELPADLHAALAGLSRQEGASLFMTLLAGFHLLLVRYSGQDDVSIGSPVANRNRSEVEGLIGFFANTLVFRLRAEAREGFRALLGQARRVALDAYAHQDLPFEKLVEELNPERDLSRSPLFQVMLVLQNAPLPPIELPDLTLSVLDLERTTARFDLLLALAETGSGLRGLLEYSTDLFEAATIGRLTRHLRTLLGGAVEAPEAPVSELPLLTREEREQALGAWRGTGPAPAVRPIHELFEEQVERTPEAPALVDEVETLSHRELEARANQLAHRLRRLGVGPEVPVALCLDRSAALVAAILGVWKAGGAYVPLDPDLPAERLHFLLADSGARVLVTQAGLAGLFSGRDLTVLALEASWAALDGESREAPERLAGPEHLAYLIYTSGSTGRPKAVMVEHRQLAGYVHGVLARMELPGGARYATVSTFAADLGNTVIFASLATGGCLHVVARDRVSDPELLGDFLERHPVDCLKIVPSHLSALLASERPERVLPRRLLVLGGEASSWPLVDRVRELAPGCRVLNHYGPTETAVGVLAFPAWTAEERRSPRVPLGRPLGGTRILLADAHGQPVPVGVPGQLFVGGPQVTRGYLGRPGLTAERFLPDPGSSEPGARLYATGDLVRYRPDGTVEFLGRIDHQVKIRGYRVELREIETALERHPSVGKAVVLAREHQGENRLVAWVVPRAGETPEIAGLRRALREALPEAMVPAAFVLLETLPLTPNGKLDRKALPEPGGLPRETGFVAPRTHTEEIVAGIWAHLLGVERLGVEESPFDLGAHSLMATRAQSRINRAFGIELPLRSLFELPSVALLAAEVERHRERAGERRVPPLRPAAREGRLPLSFSQQRLWFLDRLEPGKPVFNLPTSVRLTGELDVAALTASLHEIVRRHETLRSRFLDSGGEPFQVVDPFAPRPFPVADLSGLPAPLREGEAERLRREEARRPFDLEQGPLLRATLLRLSPREHLALMTMHHIVSDGWSLWIFTRELGAAYEALAAGRPPVLPELPVQFPDYAVWQRDWLQGEVLESELAFWKELIAGAPDSLDLPFDRPRGPVQRYRGGRRPFALPPALTARLRALGPEHGGTLFMTLLTAWNALLWRYSSQPDLTTGTVIANRHRREVESLIGFFINTLVLRTRMEEGMGFRQAFPRVREMMLDVYAHQDVPFEKLVEELNPERHLSLTPLFQGMLVLQNMPSTTLELPGLCLEVREVERAAVNYDLLFYLEEREGSLGGVLDYDVDLFDGSTVDRLLSHFEAVLQGIADAPDGRLLDLPLLSGAERQHLLLEWNDTRRGSSSPLGTFSEMFEEQAALPPDAWAASCRGERITYRDLAERVDRMSRALAARGVGRDAIVPVLAERGIGFLTAILAILRCGAAYLPLDPTHPERRIGQILESSKAALALASRDQEERLRASLETAGRPGIEIVEELLAEAPRPGPAPERGLPENLAYVIFTSGSTGQPKGVLVEARGLLNNVRSKVEDLPLSTADVVAQTASQCFDISVWQFLAVLAAGGTVRIVPDEVAHDPWSLLQEVETSGITVLEIVPSLLQAVLDEAGRLGAARPQLARLRWVMPTGEAVPSDLCRRWLGVYPHVPLLNLYGPSECSDDVSTLVIAEGWEAGHAITPIGRPLRNARLYVVDPHLTPAPVGVVGELCVGGICVGRGYLSDPARTAGSFVPDALSGEPGSRFYRTGDMARYLPDGRVEFLGRVDHQVKIRGFRIEIGEIEAVLRQHEEVGQAVVVARKDGGSARLVGYVEASSGAEGLEERLRAHLAERLPDYMVPAAFVVLERLPLSPNGKIDRKALPAPDLSAGAAFTPPRTRTEREVADVWREVLKKEEIGIEASFFDLGGHSLLAIQVLSRLRAALGVEIPLRDLFEATTVETLAARVDAALGSRSGLAAVPIRPAPAGGDLPLSFSQERLWFLEQLDPGNPAYNLPSAVLVTGEADPAVFAGVLNEIVRRHAALRTTFEPSAGRPRQIVHESLPVGFPVIDLAGLPPSLREEETVRLAVEDARRPFDLERGPLLRALLLRRGPAEHVLLLDMHHIVSDAWSMGVFLGEVAALYPALAEGRPPRLPELPVQYPDYAAWQRETLQGEVLARQLGFWKEQLAGAPPALDLPARSSRSGRLDPRHGGTRWFRLPDALAHGLQVASRQRGTTLFMTLSAGFAALLSRYSGASDLMIGVPVAGRGRTELERLIGFFVNTLVLRADLTGSPSVGELLARVRRATLDAFSHQDLPFEKLVAEVNPDRDLDRSPLFQVMFALQNAPAERIELPGLTLRRLEIETGTTRFEMFLEMTENGGGLEGALHYSTDRFEADFVTRFLGHFETLLQGMAADPAHEVSALPLLSASEQAVLRAWNDNAGEAPLERPFQRLFEERVALHPDRVAALCGNESLTYAALDRRANGIARQLIEQGVGPETVVALLAERGLDFLAAMLGVWKAGGAYLPLDPHHPPSRIRQILEQSRSPLVLSAGVLIPLAEEALEGFAGERPAVLELLPLEAEAPPARGGAENLAYVIFTSGSTGVPKGAMLVHRGMVNHLFAKIMELGLTENDVVAQTASQCFDISVWQFLVALAVGGRVRVYGDGVAHDPAVLIDRVEEDGVTVLETVPSLMRLMLEEIGRRGSSAPALRSLRWLVPTGEALPPELCREWHRAYPHAALLNAYGPTECSDDVSHHRVEVEEVREARTVPIGRPVLNTELYVMDAGLRPVPWSVAGELCVGGEGVGRGYLFDPVRTASVFVPDSGSGRPGARLYRTGDLARLRPDGHLEFLGRIDHQVKIRGFRLELGEIEALLGEHPGLAAVVVMARPEPSGVQRLVAYVVPRPEAEATPQDLRELLKSRLPEYAIPTAWVTLEDLPLTPNGKVDRRALPDVDGEGLGADRPYVEPRSEVEAAVAEIFAAVIGIERVGAFDNFFDLGGHSLLATQATWRLRETFGVELALRAVFEAPTVAELAGVIEDRIIEQIESLSEDEVDSLLEEDPETLEALR